MVRFINIDYIMLKNRLYYKYRLDLAFFETTLMVGSFHE